jgi:uncharacterized protein YjbI with pentapeptide repeats
LAAVAEISKRTAIGDPERTSAIAALAAFVARRDHSDIRQSGRIPEVSLAFKTLGRADLADDQIDLRYADLEGLEVDRVSFSYLPLYGCTLFNSTITGSTFLSGNAQVVNFGSAWLGGCAFTSVLFAGSDFANVFAAGTKFVDCIFANCIVTNADFSESTFINCDFTDERLTRAGRGPVRYSSGYPPKWPEGVEPETVSILTCAPSSLRF